MELPTMTTVPVIITGTTPLLCGKPAEPRPTLAPRQQALLRLYQDAQGNPVIPSLNLFRCLTGAGRLLDNRMLDLGLALGIPQSDIRIASKHPWQVDTRTVRKPGSRERMACNRPRFDDWSLSFDLQVDADLVPIDQAAALVEIAGQRLGLGDFRAERGGPFGRFRISHWGHP